MKYSEVDLSHVEAVKFGRKYEPVAISAYSDAMMDHEDFSFKECGLFIDSTFPLFGATPDGLRKCKCCDEGLLEIKYAYKHKDSNISDISDPNFYLDSDNKLKKSHRYYTQVQFQMYACGKAFCDFVVYTQKSVMWQRVLYDHDFVNAVVRKYAEFAVNDLVPELVQHKLQM